MKQKLKKIFLMWMEWQEFKAFPSGKEEEFGTHEMTSTKEYCGRKTRLKHHGIKPTV